MFPLLIWTSRLGLSLRKLPQIISKWTFLNLLSANPTKWSNTLKQFVDNLPTNCLSVFDHFVGLAPKRFMLSIAKCVKKTTKIDSCLTFGSNSLQGAVSKTTFRGYSRPKLCDFWTLPSMIYFQKFVLSKTV